MKKIMLIILSVCAGIYTVWYMHFGSLTQNSGALSSTGLKHPVLFAVWGILVFTALYSNILYAYRVFSKPRRFQYYICAVSALGMALTLFCDFDYLKRTEYLLHCAGSLTFSVLTGVCVFLIFLLNYKNGRLYAVFTYIVGAILLCDLALLLIFKQTALIEAVPVLFALVIMPIHNFTDLFKEKANASR